ncbi:hypothetical protein D0Z67_12325 [Streptomyces seoulensis]|uniref:Uncharacterized protein n=2 Tax=Streptomyces seoulensis TaxID=73044 RepID=A0A4P6U4L6_STRSO|nr:hypothetical protein D0Z67_12325 [Streptomyces seoulensis]
MPTRKMRADQQVAVIRAACVSTVPVGAAQLAEATGFTAKNCGLVPVFALNTGLLEKAHRPTMYLPSRKGRAVARAFAISEAAGLEALRSVWRGLWFGRAMRERTAHGPVTRDGLVAKLLLAARATESRIRQAHVLLDLLVVVGMIVPDGDGFLSWYEGAAHLQDVLPPAPVADAADPTAPVALEPRSPLFSDATTDGPTSSIGRRTGPEAVCPPMAEPKAPGTPGTSAVPPPRRATAAGEQPRSAYCADDDLLALLLPPVLLADLTRLTEQEVVALHGHLRAVHQLTAKLRGRPVS